MSSRTTEVIQSSLALVKGLDYDSFLSKVRSWLFSGIWWPSNGAWNTIWITKRNDSPTSRSSESSNLQTVIKVALERQTPSCTSKSDDDFVQKETWFLHPFSCMSNKLRNRRKGTHVMCSKGCLSRLHVDQYKEAFYGIIIRNDHHDHQRQTKDDSKLNWGKNKQDARRVFDNNILTSMAASWLKLPKWYQNGSSTANQV